MINAIEALTPSVAIGFDLLSFLALAAIVLIGLPHGAFDGAVALALGYGKTVQSISVFFLGYIAIAASVVVFWMVFSDVALILFLTISIWHFGIGDSQPGAWLQRTTQALAHGGLVVIGISMLHRAEVEFIFFHLIGSETILVWQFLYLTTFGLLIVLLAYLVLALWMPSLRIRFAELVGLGVTFYFLPPLVGFTLYFCGVHSVRHLRYTWAELRASSYAPSTLILLALFLTLVSWIAGILVFWQMPSAAIMDGAILRIIFIGLAALTVPHMLLVDGLFRRK